jgi:aminopeptidase
MNELQEKYASVILNSCLKVKKDKPLFISASTLVKDFVDIVERQAREMGIEDIYLDLVDPYLKHDLILNNDLETLKDHPYFNRSIWNDYAKKGASFAMLASETPNLMKDIDQKKLSDITMYAYETRKEFDELREQMITPWCIAAVPTKEWADEVIGEEDSLEKLWNQIFNICMIDNDDPESLWNQKIERLSKISKRLNDYHFRTLKYQNSLGTDFEISLPKNHLWASGREVLKNGEEILVNFPTEEVFTSPDCKSAKGIVYASKPLCYQDNLIENFWLRFEDGKVVDYGAEKGIETLKNIIESCDNSNMLGEVALVEYDSPISNSNIIFYETLYDENASCHLALGDSFPECINGGLEKTKDELFNDYNLNKCNNHVDFMVGNKDMKIVGITDDNQVVTIFENGNFVE